MTVLADASVLTDIPSGSTIAVGGSGLSRKPMGLLRALLGGGARDLEVISFLGSVDVEFLLAANAIATLHTAAVGLEGFGLAPGYRRARQEGTVRTIEWSEGSLCAAIEAAARGLPSLPCGTSPESQVVTVNPFLGAFPDPMTGAITVFARALRPEVALLHVPRADEHGNLFIDGDAGIDGLLARAAGRTIASASQITDEPAAGAAVSRIWVDAVVVDERGQWPTACHPLEQMDMAAVGAWAGSDGSDTSILELPDV